MGSSCNLTLRAKVPRVGATLPYPPTHKEALMPRTLGFVLIALLAQRERRGRGPPHGAHSHEGAVADPRHADGHGPADDAPSQVLQGEGAGPRGEEPRGLGPLQ